VKRSPKPGDIQVGDTVKWNFGRVEVIDEATDLAAIGPGRWFMINEDGGVWVSEEAVLRRYASAHRKKNW